ncbi:MAG: DNA repair and recombination protein RadB [Halobacteriota archaeon]
MTLYPSACNNVDALIGGGFPTEALSHVYGEPGTGKTTLCLQLSINVIRRGKRAIFITTDRFPGNRFAQIAGEDAKLLAQKLIVFEVKSFDDQRATLQKIKKMAKENVGLIAFDAVTTYYRLEQVKGNETVLRHHLVNQVLTLLGLARKHDLAAVMTNQVYADLETGQTLPVAGYVLGSLSTLVIELIKTDAQRRCAALRKGGASPDGEYTYFKIADGGLVDV